jgi:ubiquinone/menaquinone biosynthesis C-methylase UbiE
MNDAKVGVELTARTRAHYETFPFVEGGSKRIEHWSGRIRQLLPDVLVRGAQVLDVGCGTGEAARGLADRGARMVCLDLTEAAICLSRKLNDRVLACQADALALPFADSSFDHAVAIGVLHHTPDCRRGLEEMARVTRRHGRVVVLLYSRWTPYHLLYRMTALLRSRIPVKRLEHIPGWLLALIRLIVAAQVHQRLDDLQLKRLLADQLWTPQASFHTARQVKRWASNAELQLVRRRWLFLHANLFAFQQEKHR